MSLLSVRRRHRSQRIKRFFLCVTVIACCITSKVRLPSSRALPRAIRELRRNQVDWNLRVEKARLRPRFNPSNVPQIYVISLRRTAERRKPLVAALERLGVKYTIFPAVDGTLEFDPSDVLKYAGARRRKKLKDIKTLYSGRSDTSLILHERLRFGCYLSHVRLWERQQEASEGFQVILEDDVSLTEAFSRSLEDSLRALPESWDIFYLNSCHTKYGQELRANIRQVRGALCTHGYAISLQGTVKLLGKTALRSEKPVDHMLDEAIYSSLLEAYHAWPPLIYTQQVNSTLGYVSHRA